MNTLWDIIIVGGGPAGYTAALYAARAGFSTLVIEKMTIGGQMTQTAQIDNYPGFDEGTDGFTLGTKMQTAAHRFGAQSQYAQVLSASLEGEIKQVKTDSGTFEARALIIATGAQHRRLGLANEEKLIGRGVAYCATCDGMFYRGKTVAVVGGGNSAAAAALYLSRIAQRVILIHRRDTLRATHVYRQPLMQTENVEFVWDSTVTELLGSEELTGMRVRNAKSGEETTLELDGVFVAIGNSPQTEIFASQLELDKSGYIIADESTRTGIRGVFAAGDVRTKALRQIVTAASDGAVAAHYAEEYLQQNG